MEISERFGLPTEACVILKKAVLFFTLMRSVEYSPSKTKALLLEAELACDKLTVKMENLLSDPLAHVALAGTSDRSFQTAMQDREPVKLIEAEIEQLEALNRTLSKARSVIAGPRRGARTSALILAMFVGQLDEIMFEFTGRRLRRDPKGDATGRDFIKAV